MGTKPLAAPPAILSTGPLTTVLLDPSKLYRIGTHNTGEPYFQHSGASRFDAPGTMLAPPAPEYDSCYFGLSLDVAMAETMLHDLSPVDGAFKMSPSSLDAFYLLRFKGEPLVLADLTGVALKRLDGSADLAGHDLYDMTQLWALAVFKNPAMVDGFIYMSRHLISGKAVLLFDRAKPKISVKRPVKLNKASGFGASATRFNIVAA